MINIYHLDVIKFSDNLLLFSILDLDFIFQNLKLFVYLNSKDNQNFSTLKLDLSNETVGIVS